MFPSKALFTINLLLYDGRSKRMVLRNVNIAYHMPHIMEKNISKNQK